MDKDTDWLNGKLLPKIPEDLRYKDEPEFWLFKGYYYVYVAPIFARALLMNSEQHDVGERSALNLPDVKIFYAHHLHSPKRDGGTEYVAVLGFNLYGNWESAKAQLQNAFEQAVKRLPEVRAEELLRDIGKTILTHNDDKLEALVQKLAKQSPASFRLLAAAVQNAGHAELAA